jgi:hypothetical protein
LEAGKLGERLVRVADQLCAELPAAKKQNVREIEAALAGEPLMKGVFGAEDESLVRGLRRALVRIATALDAGLEDAQLRRIRVAIDGAEMATRGELLAGDGRHLPRLLPSFVFMVALPIVEQDQALRLSQRAAKLIDSEFGPQGEV